MHQQKIEQSLPLQEHPPRDFDTSVVFSIRGNTFSAQFDISFITGVQCGGGLCQDEYLRLTAEGHATDGETAKHTFHVHHIDLP